MKKTIWILILLSVSALAQKIPKKPKLIIGIVVDQMRYDFLYRYSEKYSEKGIKRLLKEGFNCKQTHYHYFPTVTAAGHASIYTGSMPSIHGIVGNDWFDKGNGKGVYCTEDSNRTCIGGEKKAGLMSPKNMLTTTITDQLRLTSNDSRVIGVALKDRGAILPAGHQAQAAYWFDSYSKNWVSSSFYMENLPKWLEKFNDRKLPEKYTSQIWNTLLPIEKYTESTADEQKYEAGLEKTTFPHHSKDIRTLPWGNSFTKDMAIEVLKNEQLGKGKATDFLALSFSSTDYIGHNFGPYSVEIQDTYLRLDKDLAELLTFLDSYIGKENVLIFLTADHGVADVPDFSKERKIPAGGFLKKQELEGMEKQLQKIFGDGHYIHDAYNYNLYLDHSTLKEKKIKVSEVTEVLKEFYSTKQGIVGVYELDKIVTATLPDLHKKRIINGFYPKRSGDILILVEPNYLFDYKKGTSHSQNYAYDTHVPLIFYGWNVKKGSSSVPYTIADIVPTLADWLEILEPNGSMGKVIEGILK